MTTEGKTEAVEPKPREWWLVIDELGNGTHPYRSCGLGQDEANIRGHDLVHVREVLEKTGGKD